MCNIELLKAIFLFLIGYSDDSSWKHYKKVFYPTDKFRIELQATKSDSSAIGYIGIDDVYVGEGSCSVLGLSRLTSMGT